MQYEQYRTTPNGLRKHRKICGLKQKDIAHILGHKSASRLSQWEKGRSIPSLVSAFKLAILCRTMVDSLFNDLYRKLRNEMRVAERNYFEAKQKHHES